MGSGSPADGLDAVSRAEQDFLKRNYRAKSSLRFTTEISDSLLLQYGGSQLLTATSSAISLLGAGVVASASREAGKIEFRDDAPAGGWKYFRYVNKLDARVLHC